MQINNIEKVIGQYLTMTTNYAVLINGTRGMGKTHIVKNQVADLINKTSTYDNASIKYRSLYISLYGLKSIDEVYGLMALELVPVIKKLGNSKGVKLGVGIAKILSRGFLNFNQLGSIDDYFNDLSEVGKGVIDTLGFVFVFDDLDRKSPSLEINTIVGFVNSLVEHDNNKVILVADSEIINDGSFKEVKEKTIGVVVDYVSDFAGIFDQIATGFKNRGFVTYYDFLVRNKPEIIHAFKIKQNYNLRILKFLLEHLLIVWGEIYDELKVDKVGFENTQNHRKLENAVRFAAAIAIEFRTGYLSFQNKNGLDDNKELELVMNKESIRMIMNMEPDDPKQDDNNTKSFLETFLKEYFPGNDYHYYASLYGFLTGGSHFDKSLLIQEWEQYYGAHNQIIAPQYLLYDSLHLSKCLSLSNHDLKKKNRELLTYAYQGGFPLSYYLSIFFYTERFNHIFRYDMKVLAKKIIRAIKKNKDKFFYEPSLSNQFGIEEEREYYQEYLAIFRAAVEVNEEISKSIALSNSSSLFDLFENNREAYYNKVEENPSEIKLASWNIGKTFNILKNMGGSELLDFRTFINRFNSSFERADLKFLEQLLGKMKSVKHRNNLQAYAFGLLIEKLETVSERISSYG